MGYFLFMQMMRKTKPGWGGKSNSELQVLCDPLWRALSQEEKDKYKEKKKSRRTHLEEAVRERQERDLREKERAAQLKKERYLKEKERKAQDLQTQALRMARGFMLFKQKKTKIVLLEMVTANIVHIAPEIELDRVQKHLEKYPRVKIDKSEASRGTRGFCMFSEDGKMYRCEIVSCDRKQATVNFFDYENEEENVDLEKIYQLPSSLQKLESLCVKVKIKNMDIVKNSEKNKKKVQKKLSVKNLFVCLDPEGFAVFYNDDVPITFQFSKPKSKEKEDSKGEFCLGKVEEKAEEVFQAESKFVDEVVGSALKEVHEENKALGQGEEGKEASETEVLSGEKRILEDPQLEPAVVDDRNNIKKVEESAQKVSSVSRDLEEVSLSDDTLDDSKAGKMILEDPKLQKDVEDDCKPHSKGELVQELISQLPEVEEEVLLTDSILEVLTGLVPQLDRAQSETLVCVVSHNLQTLASHSRLSSQLSLAVLANSCGAQRERLLAELCNKERLVLLLSTEVGLQTLQGALSYFSAENVAVLTSGLTGAVASIARVKLGPHFLAEVRRRFPESSAILVDEILQEFGVLEEAPELTDLFMSLTDTKSGLTKAVGWITENLSDILQDQSKAVLAVKIVKNLQSEHDEEILRLWRSLQAQEMFAGLASAPTAAPVLQCVVCVVLSGQCGAALRPEVLSVLASHVELLCGTEHGVALLKALEGFI